MIADAIVHPAWAPWAVGAACSALLVGLSCAARLLTPRGAVAAFGLGLFAFASGWAWAVPLLAFFVTSSLISRVGRGRKASLKGVVEKGATRDVGQVLANGGAAWAAVAWHVVAPSPAAYAAFLGALAAATADTWATEMGVLCPGRPRLITTWRPVERGLSGGVSVCGLLASAVGAAALVAAAAPWAGGVVGPARLWFTLVVAALAGLVGALIDSLLGATVQFRRRCAA